MMSQDAIYECDCCYSEGVIEYDLNKKIKCADCDGSGYVTIDKLRTLSKPKTGADYPGPIIGLLALANSDHDRGMAGSIPFKIGDKFTTITGTEVECIQLSVQHRGYECARFSDGGWRYNREHDRGRCTGSEWDARKNILPKFYTDDPVERDMIKAKHSLDQFERETKR